MENIQKMFSKLQRESENLMKAIIHLIYFMRGSVSFKEIMCQVTPGVRQLMEDFVDKRLEQEKNNAFKVY